VPALMLTNRPSERICRAVLPPITDIVPRRPGYLYPASKRPERHQFDRSTPTYHLHAIGHVGALTISDTPAVCLSRSSRSADGAEWRTTRRGTEQE
jgi:hypothetical protein